MSNNEKLIHEIAVLISGATGQNNLDLSTITPQTKLTEDPFNFDSVDILEAVAVIEENYKVYIANATDGAKHFQSLQTIADFVSSNK